MTYVSRKSESGQPLKVTQLNKECQMRKQVSKNPIAKLQEQTKGFTHSAAINKTKEAFRGGPRNGKFDVGPI